MFTIFPFSCYLLIIKYNLGILGVAFTKNTCLFVNFFFFYIYYNYIYTEFPKTRTTSWVDKDIFKCK